MTGGEAVVRALEAHEVEVVFGIPGTHSLPIYRHLAGSGLRHVLPRHEQGAAFAADGYARSSGRPGVCIVTTGPGITNAATAAAQAYSDSVPLLLISPGVPDAVYRRDVGFVHEAKDQSRAMDSLVAWSRRAKSPADVALAIYQAFEEFGSGRPRPVHLEIPLDVLDAEEEVGLPAPRPPDPPAPRPAEIEFARLLLAGAATPAFILGGGAQGAAAELTLLARAVGAIVFTTANGKGSYPEVDPLCVGAVLNRASAKEILRSCDVVAVIGSELGDSDLEGELPLTGQLIRVDIDRAQLHKNGAARCAIQADAACAARALLDVVEPRSGSEGLRRAQAAREEVAAEVAAHAVEVAAAAAAIESCVDENTSVVCDTSMLCWNGLVPARFATRARSFLNPTGYATLGYALPAGIGAKLATPDRDVIVVIGDGGILFTLGELATAVEQRLSLPIVVTNNGGYGEIRKGMEARGIEPIGVTFDPPDFQLLARAFGAGAARAANADELVSALRDAKLAAGPTLVEVVF